MGIPGSANPMLFGGAAAYQINQSLRFNSADSAYLNRTPASAGNRRVYTISLWFKRGKLGETGKDQGLLTAVSSSGSNNEDGLFLVETNQIRFWINNGSDGDLLTSQLVRDPSAWYHIVAAIDTTQSTSSSRVKLYLNGVQITQFDYAVYPSQNYDSKINNTVPHTLGFVDDGGGSGDYFNGYLAEVNFIDGTALTPSSFGETDTITGAWIPKKYSGSYGTNGFYLKFESSGIGTDSSGNSNTWTANNFSTSGTGTDVMSDTPTNNWCTLNPLKLGANVTLGDGNLVATMTSTNVRWNGTIAMSPGSGKYYAEMTVTQSNGYGSIGLSSIDDPATGELSGYAGINGHYKGSAYGSSYTTNDIIGIAYDAINGAVYFSKNGTWQNSGDPTSGSSATGAAESGLTGTYVFGGGIYGGSTGIYTLNFGQRSFSYTPPTGFKALNTANLPEPTIKDGSDYFNTVLYTGNGTSQSLSAGFASDLVWVKNRSTANSHQLTDSVRGNTNALASDLTIAEYTGEISLTGSGFSVSGNANATNKSAETYVGWNWKEGATQGFDIVTFTATSTSMTVNHSLGVTPDLIILKRRSSADDWYVNSSAFSTRTGNYLVLNSTQAIASSATTFTGFSSTTVSFGSGFMTNTATYVAYLWSEVAGYSKFGSYTGNGSSDGPFVFCGFRPRWILVKRTDSTGTWEMYDTARDTYNVMSADLAANLSDAEVSQARFDALSNGFKNRITGAASNASGGTYIFAAFSETAFKYSNAR